MTHDNSYDVIIIGGSYAGLSAGMALGRSLRNVLIVDSGLPCNRQTPHSHNFITQDGEKPAVIAAKAKEQVLKYDTIKFHHDIAVSGRRNSDDFEITTHAGLNFRARKIIFATGIHDIMPNIRGFADCWGISVVHCPYCHGYELREKKTGILANGDRAIHLASLVRNLTNDVTLLTSGQPDFSSEQLTKLRRNKIEILEDELAEIEHDNGNIRNIVLKNGARKPFDTLYAAIPFKQHSDIPALLGCELTEQGHIKIDTFQKTTVEGIYACGDNSSPMRSVASAVYSGNLTGAVVNRELTDERF